MKKGFLLLLLCLLGRIHSEAQPLFGLDPTFANNGIYAGDTGSCAKIAIQQDGKIVILGGERKNGEWTTAMRFNSDGSIDNNFADNGYFQSSLFQKPLIRGLTSICLQPDGKILLSGSTDTGATTYDFLLMRLKQDGTLDSGFGGGGYVMTAYIHPWGMGAREYIFSTALQSDGKIVAYGYSDFLADTLHIVRYYSDGEIDSSFGNNGRVKLAEGFEYPTPNDIAIMPDGKIVLGAKARISALNPPWGAYAFTAIRLLSNGSLDTSFNHTGIAYTNTNLGWLLYCTSMRLQADGKILLAGHGDSIAVVRFDASGNQDNSFGKNGLVKLDPAGRTKEIQVQPDGKIVLGGDIGDTCIVIYRILSDGTLDSSFGVNGKVTTKILNATNRLGGIVLQQDGRIVGGGGYYNGNTTSKLLLLRYTPNATFVYTNDLQEKITLYPNPTVDYLYIDNATTQRLSTIMLYSTDGKLLRTQTYPNTNRLSTDGLADGIYYLHIRFTNHTTLVKKIIIQKH